jgi:hypothetical protein
VSINLNNDIIGRRKEKKEERPAPQEERNAAAKGRRMKIKEKKKLARLKCPTSMLGNVNLG